MQTFKTKVLSLITAVCMIATTAAPVFGAEGDTWDSGNGFYDSGNNSCKITVTSGTGTTTTLYRDENYSTTVDLNKNIAANQSVYAKVVLTEGTTGTPTLKKGSDPVNLTKNTGDNSWRSGSITVSGTSMALVSAVESSSAGKYTVTATATPSEGGSIAMVKKNTTDAVASGTQVDKDIEITATVTVNAGYKLGTIKVNDAVKTVEANEDGKYVFVVGPITAATTIAVTFTAESGQTKAATPEANPTAGAVKKGTVVKLSSTTAGAKIYYTTDGTTPTASSMLYTDTGIAVNADMTIKAIAIAEGFTNSDVLEAKYTLAAVEYTVKAYNGTTVVNTATVAENGEYTLPAAPAPAPAGKVFAGWNTDKSAATGQAAGTKVTITGNTEFYAIWADAPKFTLKYDPNGGTGTAFSGGDYEAGKAFTVSDYTEFTAPAGKKFSTWNDKADGTGTSYGVGTTQKMPSSNLTLYAIWVAEDAKLPVTNIKVNDVQGGYAGEPKSGFETADAAAATLLELYPSVTGTAGGKDVTIPVTKWTGANYSTNAGYYTFTATLGTVPAGYEFSGEVTVKVTFKAKTSITGFETISDVSAGKVDQIADGMDKENAGKTLLGMYGSVTGSTASGAVKVPVVGWTSPNYDPAKAGTYTFTAKLNTPVGYTFTGSVTVNVVVSEKTATMYKVTSTAPNGTVTLKGGTLYTANADVSAVVKANANYKITGVTVKAGTSSVNANVSYADSTQKTASVSFDMPAQDAVITVTFEDTSSEVSTEVGKVVDAIGKGDTAEIADAAKDLVESVPADDLKENTVFMNNIGKMEEAYADVNNITILEKPEVKGNVPTEAKAAAKEIKMEGAALSADAGSTVQLVVAEASANIPAEDLEDAASSNVKVEKTVAIDISLDGVSGDLKAPVKLSIPVPANLSGVIRLFHLHDGVLTEVGRGSGTISITVTGFSTFVFAEVTETSNSGSGSGNIFRPSGSHSSGGSGGGGGGSHGGSRYNNSQSLFDKSTSTINGILKGLLTGGKTGSTVTGSTTTVATGSAVTKAQADKAVSSAVSQAKAQGSDSAVVLFRNASAISSDVLSSIASQAQKSGLSAYVTVDTVKNGAVDVRLSVLASAAARTGRAIDLSASVGSTVVENHFARYFSNNVKVVSMGQKGSFGTAVEAAVRVNLSGMDTSSLRFYTYDAATNAYHEIAQSNYFIDANGYVHFTTDMGNYIVITDQPLTLK